ncbi:hypothetical protein ACYOEI_12480 [Singulisphaera rosea]
MEFTGEFETHVTVGGLDDTEIEAVRNWAVERGLKFHHIVLDRGVTPSQPMVSRRGRGHLSEHLAEALELCRALDEAGFVAARVKIEAAPWNGDVPDSDVDADSHPTRYFEHHIKLVLDPETDLQALGDLAETHGAHLSRNARSRLPDGRSERFVTQRCYHVGRSTAVERLRGLVTVLRSNDYAVLNVEEEYVVYDSNPQVDAGWLERGGRPCPEILGNSSSE